MDNLRSVVRGLFAELNAASIDYVLVGGVALLTYVAGRNTQDIDLIVDPAQTPWPRWQATIQDADFGAANYCGLHIDLLLTTNPLFAYVRRHEVTTIAFDDLAVRCATREGLVLLKLYALPSLYRQGNLARAALYETDIFLLMQGVQVDDAALLSVLQQYLAAPDVAELRRILDEQRTRRRFAP
jgi:hypothetical protein